MERGSLTLIYSVAWKRKERADRIDLDREESNLGSLFKLERVDDRLSRKLKLIEKLEEIGIDYIGDIRWIT